MVDSHLLSCLKGFFRTSRVEAPDERQPVLHSKVMLGNGFPSASITRLSRSIRFFRLLSLCSHQPRLHSACPVNTGREHTVTDCPSMSTRSTHRRSMLSAGGIYCPCRLPVDSYRPSLSTFLVRAFLHCQYSNNASVPFALSRVDDSYTC